MLKFLVQLQMRYNLLQLKDCYIDCILNCCVAANRRSIICDSITTFLCGSFFVQKKTEGTIAGSCTIVTVTEKETMKHYIMQLRIGRKFNVRQQQVFQLESLTMWYFIFISVNQRLSNVNLQKYLRTFVGECQLFYCKLLICDMVFTNNTITTCGIEQERANKSIVQLYY